VNPEDSKKLNELLSYAIQVVGRLATPPETVRTIVATTKKHVRAYNLCDGVRTQQEIAKAARIDQGNFSRAANRWVENGVAFWLGSGRDKKLLHLYPIPERPEKKKSR